MCSLTLALLFISHLEEINSLSSHEHSDHIWCVSCLNTRFCLWVCVLLELNWWFKAAQSNLTSEQVVFICLSPCDFITAQLRHTTVHIYACVRVCVCSRWIPVNPFIFAILKFSARIWSSSTSLVRHACPSRSVSHSRSPDWWHYIYRSIGHNTKSVIVHFRSFLATVSYEWNNQWISINWPKTAHFDAEHNRNESWTCSCQVVVFISEHKAMLFQVVVSSLVSEGIKRPQSRAIQRPLEVLNQMKEERQWFWNGGPLADLGLSGRAGWQVAVMSLIGLCGVKLCSLCAGGLHKNPWEHREKESERAFMRRERVWGTSVR